MDLKDKVVIITGGAVRLGRAMALRLAGRGAKIFCHYYTSSAQAADLKDEIEAAGGTAEIFKYDLTKTDAPKKICDAAIERFSAIDILINNAALFYKTPFGEVTYEDWDTFNTLNLKSAFFLTQEAAKTMLKRRSGKIVNIADAAAETPFPSYLPYSISKSGIITMTKGLAKALAPHITVNCISPGPVLFPEDFAEEEKQYALNQTLLKRGGSPDDIVRALTFLLEDGDYLTGAVIPVDGGRHVG